MPRLVKKTAHGPYTLNPQSQPVIICMCGLSKNQPFCDQSHLKTVDEDDSKLYTYNDQGKKTEVCCDCEGCKEGCKPGTGCCGGE